MININRIKNILLNRFGVIFNVKIIETGENLTIDITAEDVNVSETFLVRVKRGWRSITADFIPGNFSNLFIKEMGRANKYKKTIFKNIAEDIIENGIDIKLLINNQKVETLNVEEWETQWNNITFQLKKIPVDYDEMNEFEIEETCISISTKIIGLIMSLVPLEENSEDVEVEGLPEGSKSRIEVNKYERSSLNRAMCIDVKGTRCYVCDFDFGECYGEIGEGFIHVHHTTPVSEIGPNYIINPIKDLVPVCPNCHAMLHTSRPPLSTEELKMIISSKRQRFLVAESKNKYPGEAN